MANEKIAVALSGGLDSAAAVLLLREQGYEPYGLYLDLVDDPAGRRKAEETARQLDVPLRVEPLAELFRREIVEDLLAQHRAGRTPAPCSRCNPRIKWKVLGEVADRMGIEKIATGHYVRTIRTEFGGVASVSFRRGVDPVKDQSYYLWDVPEPLIRRAVMPLGETTKAEVRAWMKERYGLTEIADQRESMGVCFLKGTGYGDFLRKHLDFEPGDVFERETGVVIGRHEGYPLYTIGQKRGFTVDAPSGSYTVVGTDPARNQVLVSKDPEALYTREIYLTDWRIGNRDELLEKAGDELTVMVRGLGRNPQQPGCRVEFLPAEGNGQTLLKVTLLNDKAWAVCPGQPCAFYLGDRLVGGGIVTVPF